MKIAAPLIALTLLLTGCTASGSASLTVPASTIEKQATGALEDQFDDDFTIDCGDDDVKLIDGTEVECVLTDATDTEHDTVVTISDVKGTKYHIDVNVAGDPEAEPTEDAPLVVDAETIAGVAAGALAPQLGYDPTITCDEGVELVVDNSISCAIMDDQGGSSTVLITITKVDGTDYSINAKVQ